MIAFAVLCGVLVLWFVFSGGGGSGGGDNDWLAGPGME